MSCGENTKQCDSSSDSHEENAPCTPCCCVQSCSCVYLFTNEFKLAVLEFEFKEEIPTKNEFAQSNYLADIWNPPRYS